MHIEVKSSLRYKLFVHQLSDFLAINMVHTIIIFLLASILIDSELTQLGVKRYVEQRLFIFLFYGINSCCNSKEEGPLFLFFCIAA